MSKAPTPLHGVMEGAGAYNRYAKLPASGADLAVPLLQEAVGKIQIDGGDQPVVIADYGSSQGKNSMLPMKVAIGAWRKRVGIGRSILVFQHLPTLERFQQSVRGSGC
jgi:hypothetical protein